jgi:ABC-type transport system substrate-binding protein
MGVDPKQVARNPVATGPFKFKEWVPDTHIKYERFDGYWGGPANLDAITYKVIKDENARLAAVRAGDVDFVQDISYSVLPVVKSDKSLNFITTQPLFRTYFIIGKNPKFQDVRIRQAVGRYGLPRERIAKEVYGEGAEVAVGPVSSVSKWYIDYKSLVPYDPQKSKQLLAAAGVPNLEFDTIYVPGDQSIADALLIWQSAMKEIGAKMNLVAMDAPAYFSKVMSPTKDYDVGFGASVGPISDLGVLGGTHHTGAPANSSGGGGPEIDALLDKAQATLDFSQRKTLYDQAFRLIIEDAKQYYVTFFPAHRILSKRLQGYGTDVSSRFVFKNASLQ